MAILGVEIVELLKKCSDAKCDFCGVLFVICYGFGALGLLRCENLGLLRLRLLRAVKNNKMAELWGFAKW